MYIETRYYDNGIVEAHLRKARNVNYTDDKNGMYDFYFDKIDNVKEWVEGLEIEHDDIGKLVHDLESGLWVDISAYC